MERVFVIFKTSKRFRASFHWVLLLTAFSLLSFLQLACASKTMKLENSDVLLRSDEYYGSVKVVEIGDGQTVTDWTLSPADVGVYVRLPGPKPIRSQLKMLDRYGNVKPRYRKALEKLQQAAETVASGDGATKVVSGPTGSSEVSGAQKVPRKKQPEIEDDEGFDGRRPIVDPFRVGEKTVLEMSFFAVAAGDLTIEVKPFKQVNGRKSYHFQASAKSSSVFSMFYAVDDWVETYVDYDRMIPFNYALHVKESKQLRETRSYIDWKQLKSYYWDKRVPKDGEVEEKKYDWDILEWSQNVFSGPFYMRTFQMKVGKKFQFRIAHEKQNILVTAEVIRKEKLSTAIGELDTVVVRPKFEIDGNFKPVGEILIWFTDDERRFMVRLESKIKIGTVVGEVKELVR